MYFSGKSLDFFRPQIMGILNTTPDSFHDGGNLYKNGKFDLSLALYRAEEMVKSGAAILDIGGESTRPGAEPVSLEEEIDRVAPVIESVASFLDVIISIDTSKAKVIEAAVDAGANMINDVRALREPGTLDMAAKLDVPICLMHMQGKPQNMQCSPQYKSVTNEVFDFMEDRIQSCKRAGISEDRLIVDPGFGFGKSVDHNIELLRNLREFSTWGHPILVGLSRKSMISSILRREEKERLPASLILAAMALDRGANLLRVHDVQETSDLVSIWMAVKDS